MIFMLNVRRSYDGPLMCVVEAKSWNDAHETSALLACSYSYDLTRLPDRKPKL